MEAKETLRSMFDHRKQMWKIVKKTAVGAGGWRRFGARWYFTQGDADTKIKKLIENQPNEYQRDSMAAINSITYREVKFIPGTLALKVRAACKEAYKMNSDMHDILRGINYRLKEIKTGNDSTTDHHYRVAVSETGRQIDVIHLKANHDDDAVMITIIAE